MKQRIQSGFNILDETLFLSCIPEEQRKSSVSITVSPFAKDAWIITDGTNVGVMKSIGEAVRDYGIDIVTIGIVPSEFKQYWNYLELEKVIKGTKK